ncbi:MAG TPA: hypothetical protein VMI73_05270 [Trebonia sp.]|nr:hypothetical protein [Trebonia sp.]
MPRTYAIGRSSGLAGLPSALTARGSMPSGKNGLTVAPEAAMPATTRPPSVTVMPPGPPASIRDAVIRLPDAPTTAIAPRRPSCSALSTARLASARASAMPMSRGCGRTAPLIASHAFLFLG